MEETVLSAPNNDGKIVKLQIKQKNINIKKRKVKTWTSEEDQKLIQLYEEYPKRWNFIASLMNDRNQNQCLHRYRRLSQMGTQKKIWSTQQDKTILSLMKKVGKNWKLLSEILGTKTGKQIRQRFINKLDPKIKNEQWSNQQDMMILKYYSQVGSRWSEISKKLPGRPQNKIKNRFYSFIQKNYDLKYEVVDVQIEKLKEESEIVYERSQKNIFSEKIMNQQIKVEQSKDVKKIKCFPSIKQFDDFKVQDIQNHDFSMNSNHKLYLKSLIRIQDEGNQLNQYKSIRQIVSNNDINNQNDFFYLSN